LITKGFKFLAFSIAILTIGCSPKKNRFLNREYNAMTSEYNILYNGELAFQEGLDEINKSYVDNYWEILPIEPLEIKDDIVEAPKLNRNKKNDKNKKQSRTFELAEEKAVKAVQKHSMLIKGIERNRKIDDAFLLLGKARYYSQRFVPALEAFNYITKNYPEANLMDETLVWKAKTNIRLENEEIAIESLYALANKDKISDAILEDIYTTQAIAFTQLDSVEGVIDHLKKAISISKNSEKKSRNLFVLGQLFRKVEQIENSQIAFQRLIDFKKAPYKLKLHAEIEMVKNHSKGNQSEALVSHLEKLIKIRENRPYLGELYYQLALLELERGNDDLVIDNFQKSIHTKSVSEFQKGLSYEALGNYYFDKTSYKQAGAYYDSVLQISQNKDSKRIRKVSSKSKSLETVLVFEDIIKRNDSLWGILAMDVDDQYLYYLDHVNKLKAKDEAKKKEAKLKTLLEGYASAQASNPNTAVARGPSPSIGSGNGKWYFYNTQTISYGKQDFTNVWGKRKLRDNWRWSDTSRIQNNEEVVQDSIPEEKSIEIVPLKYKVEYYLDQLPNKVSDLDSISKLRSITYYQLGLIYKEQFKEDELAARTLERLLEIFPEDKLVLGTNYHLYKIYKGKDEVKSERYANVVLMQFPKSIFAKMIANPGEYELEVSNGVTPESRYKEVYQLYKSQNYIQAVYEISDALRIFEGNKLVPKYELLKAYSILRIKGKDDFAKILDYIVLNYANTPEAVKAKELLDKLK
jgi:tetratricopeptide (TPR) repeat protein